MSRSRKRLVQWGEVRQDYKHETILTRQYQRVEVLERWWLERVVGKVPCRR